METLVPTELLYLDVTRVADIARTDARVAFGMLTESNRVLELTHRSYSIRVFGSLRVRVANAILERATTCGRVSAGTVVEGTQHELAIAAGTVREVVAAALRDLKRDGIVATRRGAIVIIDPERLASEADGGLGLGLPA
jgi:CRP/FNR family transcriptional regulator